MSMIDIQKGFRQYSPAQLREYCYQGLLSSGRFELSDFVEYIFTDVNLQEDLDKMRTEAYSEGFSDGKHEGLCENWDEEFK